MIIKSRRKELLEMSKKVTAHYGDLFSNTVISDKIIETKNFIMS